MRRFLSSFFTLFFSAHLYRRQHLVAQLLLNDKLFFTRLFVLIVFVDGGRFTHLAINLAYGLGLDQVFRHWWAHLEILMQLANQGKQVRV